MQIKLEQLESHLAKGLAPVYFVHGDETLLVQEACDAIRGRARAEGYADREVFNAEAGFDWNALSAAANAMSLFAERRILELRMPGGKPGDAGAKALRAYAERPPEETLLLVIAGKLEPAQRKSQWVRALERAGVAVQVWPVGVARLPAWIRARMRARGLDPTAEAVALISERVEGNLLAAAQEIDKLFLLHGGGRIDAADVTDAVADSARFTVFALVDCVLAADEARAVRVLEGLRGEGASPVMIASVLAREVRNLGSMRRAIARGESPGRVLAAHRVWESRKSAVTAALKRHRPEHWDDLLRACARLDRVVKGQAPGNPWDELIQLALWIAGKRPLVAAV